MRQLLATMLGLAAAVGAEVGVTDGPKGVVVTTRNGKAYAAFPDLGIVKIVNGAAGRSGCARCRAYGGLRFVTGAVREHLRDHVALDSARSVVVG